MSYAIYVYTGSNLIQNKIRADQLNWTGTWSATGTYHVNTYDAVQSGQDKFIATTDSINSDPVTGGKFGELVILMPGDEPPFQPPSNPSQSFLALETAWAGTAAAAAGIALANQALLVALNGTVTPFGIFQTPQTIATSTSPAPAAGYATWDSNFVYVSTGSNQWKRSALSSW